MRRPLFNQFVARVFGRKRCTFGETPGPGTITETGTPQGATVSQLLANLFLHYVFDLWANQWRRRNARGNVIIVRYADDIVVGFQHRWEAERFRAELSERMGRFGLQLHPEKTRLIEFGRFAADNRRERGRSTTW